MNTKYLFVLVVAAFQAVCLAAPIMLSNLGEPAVAFVDNLASSMFPRLFGVCWRSGQCSVC